MKHLTTILKPRQHELEARLDPAWQPETEAPVVGTGNLVYELGEKVRAIAAGGIGLVEQLVDAIGLRARLDERVHVFTRHWPYHESDHILTMTYNVLTGGQALEDIDRLRNDVTFLDAVGARRLPDPTTAGDFLRRFTPEDVTALMEAQNDARLCVWNGTIGPTLALPCAGGHRCRRDHRAFHDRQEERGCGLRVQRDLWVWSAGHQFGEHQ